MYLQRPVTPQTIFIYEKVARNKNPVISAGSLDSCHPIIHIIRDKIGSRRSRMMVNHTNFYLPPNPGDLAE